MSYQIFNFAPIIGKWLGAFTRARRKIDCFARKYRTLINEPSWFPWQLPPNCLSCVLWTFTTPYYSIYRIWAHKTSYHLPNSNCWTVLDPISTLFISSRVIYSADGSRAEMSQSIGYEFLPSFLPDRACILIVIPDQKVSPTSQIWRGGTGFPAYSDTD